MGKNYQTTEQSPFAETALACADNILQQSKALVLQVKGQFEPGHKAYMSLALAASEAIKAFVALDESLKK